MAERTYSLDQLPYNEDLSRFAPAYFPEQFSDEQRRFLKPFFTNLDRPIYLITNLPEEVAGALSSRYSRSTHRMRELFWREYVTPILKPETQKDWEGMNDKERKEAQVTRDDFIQYVDYLNSMGGIDRVVNAPRARKFYETWYVQFGDESIVEETSFHVCTDGMSAVTLEEAVNKRLGLPLIVKSSRYVPFHQKRPDGTYQYVIPGEIKGTELEAYYTEAMDRLFTNYADFSELYFDYITGLYPKGEDESDVSFRNSRSAKRFDDIRDLLPFATQVNVAFNGFGRAYNDLINRFLGHPLGEVRWWGQAFVDELSIVAPSLFTRPKDKTGAKIQLYRGNLQKLRDELSSSKLLNGYGDLEDLRSTGPRWARLLSYTENVEDAVIAPFLWAGDPGLSFEEVLDRTSKLSSEEKHQILSEILQERKFQDPNVDRAEVRFRKVPREFENAVFLFEFWGRGGDFRDLHRHRINTEQHQRFTTRWGYDLELEVLNSPFVDNFREALRGAEDVFTKLYQLSPDVAQYAVPYAYLQHWYWRLSAREIYYISELRTGPQGRPHYRQIVQEMARLASGVSPALFQGMFTDWSDYSLARRESEKKIYRKLQQLEEKK